MNVIMQGYHHRYSIQIFTLKEIEILNNIIFLYFLLPFKIFFTQSAVTDCNVHGGVRSCFLLVSKFSHKHFEISLWISINGACMSKSKKLDLTPRTRFCGKLNP